MEAPFFKEEHHIFRKTFREFIRKEITPNAEKWENEKCIPRDLWYRMGEQGYLCPWVEEKYGGFGAGFEYSVILHEEMSRSEVSGIGGMGVHSDIIVPYIHHHGNEKQKSKYLPGCVRGDIITSIVMSEPEAGSDLVKIRTKAVREGSNYVVNGQKVFITNGIRCNLAVVAVKTDPKADPPHKGVSILLIEEGTPGFIKGRLLEKTGAHSQDTAELFFEDCLVPQENLLGEEGMGFHYLMYNLQQERLICSIGAQATAEYVLEKTIEYCRTRTVFGRPVSRFQHNTFKIVEMATEVEIGRAFLNSLIEDFIGGKEITLNVSMAKWWITEMVNRIAYHCTQLHGGYGCMKEYYVARAPGDVRLLTIAAGTTEIMKVIIGNMMGL
ncbi:MAG: acyl-CoA dehydrogenase family protein [Thermodesulfobacteriota bacterium]|nr:acyl-CoA dehydrogenase family protein [Thermodesulfobacteriota bacterium]